MDEVNAGRYETGREPMARFWSPGDDPYALHKVDNSHWCNPVLAEAVLNRQIGRLAAQLLETAGGASVARADPDEAGRRPRRARTWPGTRTTTTGAAATGRGC